MQTVVIIGASNVTLALPMIWNSLIRSSIAPVRLLVAAGHGRSLALPSSVLGRTLPSIYECGLWAELQQESKQPAMALITDVGNDLLYGAPAKQIDGWLEECVQRLVRIGARVTLTRLPMESLGDLSAFRFGLFRRLLFPRSELQFEDALQHIAELNTSFERICEQADAALVGQERHWYGADPIHVKRRFRPEAWQRYLAAMCADIDCPSPGPAACRRVWNGKAAIRWRGQRRLETLQPVLRHEESELHLY